MAAAGLGRSLWRALPALKAGARRPRKEVSFPDFPAVLEEMGHLPRLERKPWVMLSDVRNDLEDKLGLETDQLLAALARWLEDRTAVSSAVGLAFTSGNIYFAPSLEAGPRPLAPEQVLVGNLFSHGEIGLQAFASTERPTPLAGQLLREVSTFKRMRWLEAYAVPLPEGDGVEPEPRELGTMVRRANAGALHRHPLVSELLGLEPAAADSHDDCCGTDHGGGGSCLQHKNYGHLDVEGEGIDELQASVARIAAARAYCPHGGRLLVGCGVRTANGALYAGHAIGTGSGLGALSPLQAALVSMGANGQGPDDIVRAVWAKAGADEDRAAQLCDDDMELLSAVAPQAEFAQTEFVQPSARPL